MTCYDKKLELHCHTVEFSHCARMCAEELAYRYKAAGYAGIHIVEHFTDSSIRAGADIDAQLDSYYLGYRMAKAVGDRIGLKVYTGVEYRFSGSNNDFLLFGATREDLREAPLYFGKSHAEFHGFCRERGILFFQAHPFRPGLTPAAPEDIDGIEAFNMHPGHNSRNELALAYAEKHGLPVISGSDCHDLGHVGRGGILVRELPDDEAGLVRLLKSGDYALIGA